MKTNKKMSSLKEKRRTCEDVKVKRVILKTVRGRVGNKISARMVESNRKNSNLFT